MQEDRSTELPQPVTVTIRVDGSTVGEISTVRIGKQQAYLPTEQVPLTKHSFLELALPDGDDHLIVPGIVTHVGPDELTVEYEQTGESFDYWLATQMKA